LRVVRELFSKKFPYPSETEKSPPFSRRAFGQISLLLNDMYALLGAGLSTFAAAYALALIDVSKVIGNGDSLVLAGLNALHAADAACLASLHSLCALLLVVAHYKQLVVSRNNLDNVIGAGLSAKSAADAGIRINVSNAVLNIDSILGANLSAVAETHASEGAGSLAAEQDLGSLAGFHALILILIGGVITGTVASYNCDHGDNVACIETEQSADALGSVSAAGNTEVSSGLIAGDKSLSVRVTAGIAAGTAVSAGQALTNRSEALIYRNRHELGCNRKNYCTDKSDYRNGNNCQNNSTHSLISSSIT